MKLQFLLIISSLIILTGCANTTQKTKIKLTQKCYEKPEKGRCKALFHKYYFDKNENKCKKFVWGGCGGNVPFKTLESCKSSCEN